MKKKAKLDFSRADTMTQEQRHAAALADPDARPMTEDEYRTVKPLPRVLGLRRALRMTQEEFAAKFHIPLGTLRDWEQRRKAPDAAARAYLKVIARNPKMVAEALGTETSARATRPKAA